jgi:hypothetical protein
MNCPIPAFVEIANTLSELDKDAKKSVKGKGRRR